VTSLDPRTLHQPEKLQKLSKNDYGFTPSKIWVNRKIEIACALVSIECSSFTGGCSAICAATHDAIEKRREGGYFSSILTEFVISGVIKLRFWRVKIPHNPRQYCELREWFVMRYN
jgi:hypothetical protein